MNCFAVLVNSEKTFAGETAGVIRDYLTKHGKTCGVFYDSAEIPGDAECVLVLGGDGTLLRAAKLVRDRELPLLGINLGTVGYLAEVEKNQIIPALERLLCEDYTIENRMMLYGTVSRKGKLVCRETALNDIVINRLQQMRTFKFKNYVNGAFLNEYRADGMILSTPTGSTGYTLSVGGPIVSPMANLIMITPIAAHTLNSRTIVLPGSDRVTVEIGYGRTGETKDVAAVYFDGEMAVSLDTGDSVTVEKSSTYTRIIKINNISFLEVLRQKLAD